MALNAEAFLEEVSWETFDNLKKPDLMLLAKYLDLETKQSMRKNVVKNILIDRLVEDDFLDNSYLENKIELEDPDSNISVKLKRLEIEREIELKKLKLEEDKLRLKEKLETERMVMEHELKEKELEMNMKLKFEQEKQKQGKPSSSFDPSRFIKFVPIFSETEVDQFFLQFEKVATSLKWPKDMWALLIQSALTGKAREVFSSLSLEDSNDYDLLKQRVLRSYELVPEAYRQQFRNKNKTSEQTHMEFAREKEQLLNRWLNSKEVTTLDQLKQVILIEEFKTQLHADIKTYLDDKKVDNIHTAASAADDYSLTHKQNTMGHQNKSPPFTTNDKRVGGTTSESVIRCNYCKKKGHIISECWTLRGKTPKPSGCAVPQNNTSITSPEFQDFIMSGKVSMNNERAGTKPVTIIRDTGCAQSMLLEGILPLGGSTKHTVIQGVGMNTFEVPLYSINLECDLVTGPVVVGVIPQLPIKGATMLLGNDLAGKKVLPEPIMKMCPIKMVHAEEDSEIIPACTITRAESQKLNEQNSESTGKTSESLKLNEQNNESTGKTSESLKLNEQNNESTGKTSESLKLKEQNNEFTGKTSENLKFNEQINESTGKTSESVKTYENGGIEVDLQDTFMALLNDFPLLEEMKDHNNDPTRSRIIVEQENDDELIDLGQRSLPPRGG